MPDNCYNTLAKFLSSKYCLHHLTQLSIVQYFYYAFDQNLKQYIYKDSLVIEHKISLLTIFL